MLNNVLKNSLANNHAMTISNAFTVSAHFRLHFTGGCVQQNDAASIGLDPFEYEISKFFKQLVDIYRLADSLSCLIHGL